MRRLLFLLFLSTIAHAEMNVLLEEAVGHCQERPITLLMKFGRIERMDVLDVIDYIENDIQPFLTTAIKENECDQDSIGLFERYIFQLKDSTNQAVISKHQVDIDRKMNHAFLLPREGREEVAQLFSEIQRLTPTVSTMTVTEPWSADVRRYLYEGLMDEIDTLRKEIEEQSHYRDPTELITQLHQLLRKEGIDRGQYGYSDYAIKRMIKRGSLAAQKRKDDCTPINNLDDTVNYSNVRDQQSVGWCVSFALADLVSHKIKERVSAVDIANAHNETNAINRKRISEGLAETEIEGATEQAAFARAKARGFCKEQALAEKGPFNGKVDYLDVLQQLEKSFQEVHQGDLVNGCFDSTFIMNCQVLLPNVSQSELFAIIGSSNWINFIDRLVAETCEGQRVFLNDDLKLKTTSRFLGSTERVWKTIDQQLQEGDIVMFDYNEDILHDHRTFDYRFFEPNENKSVRHSSLIVGRRFNNQTQSCEYLVRNSHGGNGCSGYDQIYHQQCHQGHIWVPKQYLDRSLGSCSFL